MGRDLVEFVQFSPDPKKQNNIDTTINDVLTARNKEGYLVAVSDGSIKQIHQMIFDWVLESAEGQHLAKSCSGCDGRGNSLCAEAVGMLSISIFVVLMAKHRNHTDINKQVCN